mmetsp:Transcript_33249/g.80896  ORF Transcript_33249/g.80896 Transcript_33249/m.80896 type:complete len:228 (-) Transcript_33249:52-735(-)
MARSSSLCSFRRRAARPAVRLEGPSPRRSHLPQPRVDLRLDVAAQRGLLLLEQLLAPFSRHLAPHAPLDRHRGVHQPLLALAPLCLLPLRRFLRFLGLLDRVQLICDRDRDEVDVLDGLEPVEKVAHGERGAEDRRVVHPLGGGDGLAEVLRLVLRVRAAEVRLEHLVEELVAEGAAAVVPRAPVLHVVIEHEESALHQLHHVVRLDGVRAEQTHHPRVGRVGAVVA